MKLKQYLHDMSWKDSLDEKIPYDIMNKLNKIGSIDIVSTCDGHKNKPPQIIFKLTNKKYKTYTFDILESYINSITSNIADKLVSCNIVWECWSSPTEFFYDSKTGYHTDIIKKYGKEQIKKSLCYQILIKISNKEHLDTQELWWSNIYDVLRWIK